MIRIEELTIGNRLFWKPNFSKTNLLIQVEIISIEDGRVGYIRSHLEHRVEPFEDDIVTADIQHAALEELEPIPITDQFLEKLVGKIDYPKWIQYIHELQNWYYWENEKKELELMDQ